MVGMNELGHAWESETNKQSFPQISKSFFFKLSTKDINLEVKYKDEQFVCEEAGLEEVA